MARGAARTGCRRATRLCAAPFYALVRGQCLPRRPALRGRYAPVLWRSGRPRGPVDDTRPLYPRRVRLPLLRSGAIRGPRRPLAQSLRTAASRRTGPRAPQRDCAHGRAVAAAYPTGGGASAAWHPPRRASAGQFRPHQRLQAHGAGLAGPARTAARLSHGAVCAGGQRVAQLRRGRPGAAHGLERQRADYRLRRSGYV